MNEDDYQETGIPQSSETSGPFGGEFDGQYDEFSPLTTIWTSPRKTIRQILDTDPTYYVVPLILLNGIAQSLDRASSRNSGDDLSLMAIILIACIAGPIGGAFTVWMYSHLIRFSGRWIGGIAGYDEIKPALAWAVVPNVAALLCWIPMIALGGKDTFTESTEFLEDDLSLALTFSGLAILQLVLAIWSIILMSNTVAEVQQFRSAWKGFGNMLLAGLVILVPILLIIIVVAVIASASGA